MWIQSQDNDVLVNSDEIQALYIHTDDKTIKAKLHSGDTCNLIKCKDLQAVRQVMMQTYNALSKENGGISFI